MNYPITKTQPWSHQVAAWNMAMHKRAFYLAFEMGCGKSKSAIDMANGWDARKVLIICPKKVIEVWPEQFDIHSAAEFKLFAPTRGTVARKAMELQQAMQLADVSNQRIAAVFNYDAFWRPPLGPTYIKNKIKNLGVLMNYDWDLLILDECHRTKSPGGRASWGAARIASKAKRRLALSGTPMPSSIIDVYAQYRALDSSIFGRSFQLFRKRYCVMGGFENKQVVAFINVEDLNQKFYSIAYRVKAVDVLDLPEVQHIARSCELDEKTMKLYRELEEEFIAEVQDARAAGAEISVDNALVKLLRLAQLAGGFAKLDDGRELIVDNSKIELCTELLEDLPHDEPVVIFTRFVNELERIKSAAKAIGRSCAEVSGRFNQLADWKANKYNTLVAQIQAGGEGIDLTRARYCIYFSVGFSLGQYLQSLARTHRPGQTRKVFYYHLIAKNTVDVKVWYALKNRKKVIDEVLAEVPNANMNALQI